MAEYEKFIRDNFGENASLVLAKYPASTEEEVQHQMERLVTDFDFALAAKFVARSMSEVNKKTYLYKFMYALPGQPYGAYHKSELYFVFHPAYWEPDPESSNVSDYVMDLWIRFARTGDPNGGINTTWPRYNPEKDKYIEMGATHVIKNRY